MSAAMAGGAVVDSGRSFLSGASGRWAGERFMRAAAAGRPISPKELRTLEVLRNEEWKVFDTQIVEGARERLVGVADLIAAGLTKTITNGLAKTVLEFDKVTDMDDAIVSMDGVTRAENDRIEYERAGLPLPIVHKDWYLNLRALLASRTGGEPMDTTYARVAGRKCGEKVEDMLFNGGKTFQGLTIYGYTTHPDRNVASFGTNGNWAQTAKTGDNVLTDTFTMISALEADGHYGPYWMYVGGTAATLKLAEDFKASTDTTIRDRLLATGRISKIGFSSKQAVNTVVLVQPSADVAQMVIGEDLQTVQWDIHGGFQINFKAFQIAIPLIRSDVDNNSGIFHMS
jgi:uncharacterized linocin/CFP29 family protein